MILANIIYKSPFEYRSMIILSMLSPHLKPFEIGKHSVHCPYDIPKYPKHQHEQYKYTYIVYICYGSDSCQITCITAGCYRCILYIYIYFCLSCADSLSINSCSTLISYKCSNKQTGHYHTKNQNGHFYICLQVLLCSFLGTR